VWPSAGELLSLTMKSIQLREEHWVIADLIGKGGHIRTVSIPLWVGEENRGCLDSISTDQRRPIVPLDQ